MRKIEFYINLNKRSIFDTLLKTPQVGFEPTTNRLTADRSTPELLRKIIITHIR